jgi:eukaryotic-like serine/threonine-protein kinase
MPALVAARYRLGPTIGRGGMGRVWRAHDERLDRDVAIKEIVPPPGLTDPEGVRRRTLREARAAARLSHPGVVQVFDVLEVDGGTWIVMEFVPCRSLQEVLAADGRLPPRRVAQIGLELVAALRAASRAGVEHRDVKPANVLLADDGRVLLTDFGIATIEGDPLTSASDAILGSPEYMPPERARNGHLGLASDLWSLGATLYAAVEGVSPFHRATVSATLTAVTVEDPAPPVHAGPLAPALEALLRKDPDDRPSAEDATRLLRSAASGAYGRASIHRGRELAAPAEAESVAGTSTIHRRWGLAATMGLCLLLAAGIALWFGLRPPAHRSGSAATVPSRPAPAASTTAPTASSSPASSASSAPAAPRSSSAAAPPPAGSGRPKLPAGWRDYHDDTGFAVYVPAGWTRSQEGSIVYFRSKGRVLGIDQSSHPKSDPVADWRSQSAYRVSHGDFPGYHQIRLTAVDYWQKAADWEFTFDRGGVRQHVDNRGFVVSSHQAYGIYWQTSDADWAADHDDLSLVYASFRPA